MLGYAGENLAQAGFSPVSVFQRQPGIVWVCAIMLAHEAQISFDCMCSFPSNACLGCPANTTN
jgi:hypothetical protein